MTFQIGDRVKSKIDGSGPYVVQSVYPAHGDEFVRYEEHIGIGPQERPTLLLADRFELYAKAGEFVVGDAVRAKYPGATDNKVRIVRKVEDGAFLEAGKYHQAISIQGDPLSYRADRFRLATTEEVERDMARVVAQFTDPKNFDKPLRGVDHYIDPNSLEAICDDISSRPDREKAAETILSPEAAAKWKVFAEMIDGANIFKPEIGKTVFYGPSEIPAAEFDFSTIKAGDEVTIKARLTSPGDDGEFWAEYRTHEGVSAIWLKAKDVHSVIPAPKPKTLRERAIEAAVAATDHFDNGLAVAAMVDAVLAEVEKGR